MDLSLLQLVLLASVFYAEARNLYLLEGHHVKLDIHGHEQLRRENIDFVHWYFHKPVVKYYPTTEKLFLLKNVMTNGTLEFDSRSFSMKLGNLRKNDSGTYRGEIGAAENHFITEYTLSILDPVSTPHLMVDSNWSSSESCNATMTCTGHDVSVTFICNGRTCTHMEGASTTDHNLVVIARHNSIFCNYSNQVSWSEAVVELGEVCPFFIGQAEGSSETSSPWRWIVISFSVGLSTVITLALLTLLILRTWKNEGGTGRDSNYEVVHSSSQAETQTLTYSTVSVPSQHILSSGVHQPLQIDDLYSFLSPPIFVGVVK